MAKRLSQRVCIKPGAVKLITSVSGGRMTAEKIRSKKLLCGKIENVYAGGVLIRVRGKLYAVAMKQLREHKQMWSFRP